jgi:hypothetical protein
LQPARIPGGRRLARIAALAEPPKPRPENFIRRLDDDKPEVREDAAKRLRDLGEEALPALDAALENRSVEGEPLGAERLTRAAAIAEAIRRDARRRELFPDDPLPEVQKALAHGPWKGVDIMDWNVSEIRDDGLETRFERLRFFHADWIGPEREPVPSLVVAIGRKPHVACVIEGATGWEPLSPYVPRAASAEDARQSAALLGGLGKLAPSWNNRPRFEPPEAEVLDADDSMGLSTWTGWSSTSTRRRARSCPWAARGRLGSSGRELRDVATWTGES